MGLLIQLSGIRVYSDNTESLRFDLSNRARARAGAGRRVAPFLPQQLARPHEELCDLRQTLLTLVNEESRPARKSERKDAGLRVNIRVCTHVDPRAPGR